jgi:hypothetical protein
MIAAAMLSLACLPALAADPEYRAIHLEIDVAKPAAETWAKIGGWCDISLWVNGFDCKVTSGNGDVGSVRVLLGGRITEIMTAKTKMGYGYTQPAVPGKFYDLYHGFMEVVPVTASSSKVLYTLMLDVSDKADAAAKDADIARRKATFETALKNMKKLAEGG